MTVSLSPGTVLYMNTTSTPVKTSATHSVSLAWMDCRCCGSAFYAPSPTTHSVDLAATAKRFGFCSRPCVARYVSEIRAILAS